MSKHCRQIKEVLYLAETDTQNSRIYEPEKYRMSLTSIGLLNAAKSLTQGAT